jgi:signal transduction histidine kinase
MSTATSSARPGSWARECAIVAVVFAISLLGGAFQTDDTLRAPPVAAYVLAAVSSATVLVRHRAPVAAMVAATVCGMMVAPLGLLPTPLITAAAVVCAYSVAIRVERRSLLVVLIPSAILLVVLTPAFETDFSLTWQDTSRLATVVAAPFVAAVLGTAARQRQRYLSLLEDRARRAEAEREIEARRKVAEERLRIARELHDLVAHQITLAHAQATVAARFFDARPDQSRESIADVVTTTHQALDDLRAAVGFLRQRDDETETPQPAPGLSQLPTLVESFRRAGLDVILEHDGTAVSLSPAMDLTAYRVIQEALTNVTKHSTSGTATVRCSWDAGHLAITITDEGRAADPPTEPRPGYGVVGMRERVDAVGGELVARPLPEGGFVVIARMPLPGAPPAAPIALEEEDPQ